MTTSTTLLAIFKAVSTTAPTIPPIRLTVLSNPFCHADTKKSAISCPKALRLSLSSFHKLIIASLCLLNPSTNCSQIAKNPFWNLVNSLLTSSRTDDVPPKPLPKPPKSPKPPAPLPPAPLEPLPLPLPPPLSDGEPIVLISSIPINPLAISFALSAPLARLSATSEPAPSKPLPKLSTMPPTASPTTPPPLAPLAPTLTPNSPNIELINPASLLKACVTALTIEFKTGKTTCNKPAKHAPMALPNA